MCVCGGEEILKFVNLPFTVYRYTLFRNQQRCRPTDLAESSVQITPPATYVCSNILFPFSGRSRNTMHFDHSRAFFLMSEIIPRPEFICTLLLGELWLLRSSNAVKSLYSLIQFSDVQTVTSTRQCAAWTRVCGLLFEQKYLSCKVALKVTHHSACQLCKYRHFQFIFFYWSLLLKSVTSRMCQP